jgi:hypothetical protein
MTQNMFHQKVQTPKAIIRNIKFKIMHMSKLTPSSYTYVTTFGIKEKNSNNCWSYRAITTPIVLDA